MEIIDTYRFISSSSSQSHNINMSLNRIEIGPGSLVSDVVAQDYRTADVFRRHGIEYCCSGRRPIETACMMRGIDMDQVIADARNATRNIQLPAGLPYFDWNIDFLIDYIVNIHHYQLRQCLPELSSSLKEFSDAHKKQYPNFQLVFSYFEKLLEDIMPHLQHEEEVIFPYLRQVAHVFDRKESFGGLFIKTLRKPLSVFIGQEHKILEDSIFHIRELTNNYRMPEKACTEHVVILSKLKALDDDLIQHVYLENEILIPKALAMEAKLLSDET